ncbi:alpha/beta fold hydrolase [Alicyclobacillus cycloheptanicus]|uniref:Esterase/lipase n=1 Tax=Alicyclobacillus cycloheptanicus TaxID=1457 RepID=A0ABT9XE66_9BACL|nr:alpha/beta fold hydrolase [Alicyclobacillus cycloheptanicus]MDQ0188588.1 esterase/lipase [Alicyclobacillus cycloheptanicus]WDM01269.1 alpha/beta fold hydrolase [Alicyclobacillus cycloheptanicus]
MAKTKETCLLIHGFTGLPSELEPLAQALRNTGYETILPRLAGHDGTFTGLRGVTAGDWIESALEPLRFAVSQGPVHLVGFSMGALIATILAGSHPVSSVTMLAPAIHYARPSLLLRQAEVFVKGRLQKESQEAWYLQQRPSGFLLTPLRSLEQFRLTVKLAKQHLPLVTVPTCVIQGDRDEIIDPKSADFVYEQVQSEHRELHHLPNSRHHVCLDVESDRVNEIVLQFLASAPVRRQTLTHGGASVLPRHK